MQNAENLMVALYSAGMWGTFWGSALIVCDMVFSLIKNNILYMYKLHHKVNVKI